MLTKERVIELMATAAQMDYGYKITVAGTDVADMNAIRQALIRERSKLPYDIAGEICISTSRMGCEVLIKKESCSIVHMVGPDGSKKRLLGEAEREDILRRAEMMREDGMDEEEVQQFIKAASE